MSQSFLSWNAKQDEGGLVVGEEDENGMIFQDVKEDEAAAKAQASHDLSG